MVADQKLHMLDEGGFCLGVLHDIPLKKGKLKYDDQSRILLFTDGMYDLENIDGEQFLVKFLMDNQQLDNKLFLKKLEDQLISLPGRPDDICIISIMLN